MVTQIPVPQQLRGPHPLVAATRDVYRREQPGDDGRLRPHRQPGIARLIVAPETLQRALLILQAVAIESKRRNFDLSEHEGHEETGVAIRAAEQSYAIEITENVDRIALNETELENWRRENEFYSWRTPPTHRRIPNGKLSLELPTRYDGARHRWSDARGVPLEAKLDQLFDEIERRIPADQARDEERRLEQARWHEEQRQRLVEQRRIAYLTNELAAWREASEIRAYAAALRATRGTVPLEARHRIDEWCDWLVGQADRVDPTDHPETLRSIQEPRLG